MTESTLVSSLRAQARLRATGFDRLTGKENHKSAIAPEKQESLGSFRCWGTFKGRGLCCVLCSSVCFGDVLSFV